MRSSFHLSHVDEFITHENISPDAIVQGSLLLVDKPEGWTSFDVVNKIRGKIRHAFHVPKIKVGHAGTLDPMATGLLLICTGKWTKKLADFQGRDKEYTGVIRLGATTASYDKETPEENPKEYAHLSEEMIRNASQSFIGEIDQVPPIYSAIKVDGRPLYESARKGKEVEIQSRRVVIHTFHIDQIELPNVHFTVSCSKGTYIRSLAYDLGQLLGCGAYLSALERTSIGEYHLRDAWNLEDLITTVEALRDQ